MDEVLALSTTPLIVSHTGMRGACDSPRNISDDHEHVALGSDYDGATSVYFDTAELSALTQALLDEDLNEEEVRAVMGGNQIRFFRKYLPQ